SMSKSKSRSTTRTAAPGRPTTQSVPGAEGPSSPILPYPQTPIPPYAHTPILAAGFALTGDIDCRDGICYSMTRFPRLEGFPLRSFLEERWGVPVRILNDGLTAALAELRAGAGREVEDFVMITLGTGIGGGVVVGGRLLAGTRGRIG